LLYSRFLKNITPHCHWMARQWSFTLFYVSITTRYPPLPFTTPLMLLIVRHVVGVVGLSCCLCHGEVLPPTNALWRWWNFFMIRKEVQKKNLTFTYASNQNWKKCWIICDYFYRCLHFRLFCKACIWSFGSSYICLISFFFISKV
jgi:hypothetical protein